MWQGTNFKSGAGLGAGLNKPLGQFSCVPKDLGNAWTMSRDQKYWEAEPNAPISKIKIFVTHIIEKAFSDGDRIAIRDIYRALTQPPYGFMPVAQTAFVYHLHICQPGDNDELYFRDYLNEHPEVARAYETLKLGLWKKYEHNHDAYTGAKTEFIERWTSEARRLYGKRYGYCSPN